MTELLTAAQMRKIEQDAIASGAATGLELMERAGQGVVDAVFAEWPELAQTSHRAVILCGPGNNGGDGFVVARLLKKWGWEVEVFLYGNAEKLPADARVYYERWGELGEVSPIHAAEASLYAQSCPDLVVDAIFGTGLTRPIEGLFDLFLELNEETLRADYYSFPNYRLTAIDMPSGICSDSGRILEPASWTNEARWWRPTHLDCQLTVTFHGMKVGHHLADGPGSCAKIVLKDIGLHD